MVKAVHTWVRSAFGNVFILILTFFLDSKKNYKPAPLSTCFLTSNDDDMDENDGNFDDHAPTFTRYRPSEALTAPQEGRSYIETHQHKVNTLKHREL